MATDLTHHTDLSTHKPLIYFADLRHVFQGNVYVDTMPLGIGYMKAVMDEQLPEVESKLFAFAEKLGNAIDEQLPDVLLLTNYMWNEKLSYYFAEKLKQAKPDALVIMGGPNFPLDDDKKIEYLKSKPAVDLYVTGEGDFLATEIVRAFLKAELNIEELLKQEFHSSIYYKTGQGYVVNPLIPRSKNLDDIPSPWLTGIMDEFFEDQLFPLFETNRGCPFTCTFCVQGTKWYTKVNYFGLERLRDEIYYIGKMVHSVSPQVKTLVIADPNYGMFKRDVEISGYIGEIQKEYGFPLIINATTGKNQAETIIKSLEKVNGALVMYQAVQSLDENVLENVKRTNIKLETYEQIQTHIKARGLRSNSDLILGLPGDSLNSHIDSLCKLINAGTSRLNNFQAILLKGSEMETEEARKKYAYDTKYRLLPKTFGTFRGDKIFEVEEIIVSSADMSFDDYLTARKYHLSIGAFWNHGRFQPIVELVNRYGITSWDWMEAVTAKMNERESFKPFLNSFIKETKGELFDSEEAAIEFYSKEENFALLTQEGIGDNIFYKYAGLAMFFYWDIVCDCAFSATIDLLKAKGTDSELLNILEDAGKYFSALYASGTQATDLLLERNIDLAYDIPEWLDNGLGAEASTCPTQLHLQLDEDSKASLLDVIENRPYDLQNISKFIRRVNAEWLKRSANKPNSLNGKAEKVDTVTVHS